MVILTRSFRAVLRKESWMFCAGLLLSIADLLQLNCQLPTAGPGRFEPAPNHSRFPSLPALKEQGGTRRQKYCFPSAGQMSVPYGEPGCFSTLKLPSELLTIDTQ